MSYNAKKSQLNSFTPSIFVLSISSIHRTTLVCTVLDYVMARFILESNLIRPKILSDCVVAAYFKFVINQIRDVDTSFHNVTFNLFWLIGNIL